jgi:hypothetical protein
MSITLQELIDMAYRRRWRTRIPMFLDIEGHEMRLDYRYSSTSGVHFIIAAAGQEPHDTDCGETL